MKSKNIYRILICILTVTVLTGGFCFPSFAEEQAYVNYSITSQADGLSVSEITYSNGRIDVVAQLDADKMTEKYNAVTLVALNPSGVPCAIREDEVDESGAAEFWFNLDTTKSVSGQYTFNLNNVNTGMLVLKVNVYDGLADAIAELSTLIDEVRGLIAQCDAEGVSADYERIYLSVAERSAEIMRESDIYSEYIDYNMPICKELLVKAKTNLTGYLDGSLTPYSVPKVKPDSVTVSGGNLVADVSDGGIEYSSPVFLNGYNLGWENRDESGFLNNVGVNSVPHTIAISRIIGKPNMAYKWSPSGTGAANGTIFKKGDGNLHISGDGSLTGMIYQMVSLTAGETYKVRFRAKGNSSGRACIRIGKSGETDAEWVVPGSSDWKTYEYTYTPTETYKPEFKIVCSGAVAGAYIDDLSFTDSSGNEILANGSFDEWFDITDNCSEGVFGVNSAAIEAEINTLEKYRDNGYSVVLTGGFSSMPSYVTTMSGVKDSGASYGSYFPYNPTHPMILSAIETYLEAVLPEAEKVGNVMCFMIHNEPNFNSYGKLYYLDGWEKYLTDKYTNISALNSAYGTEYASFADVPMQNSSSATYAQKLSRAYYDWRVFNDTILTEYHNTVIGYIENILPGMPVATKIMQETTQTAALVQHYGADYEAFGVNMDINGNDGWARPDTSGQSIQAQIMWYDYQRSIKTAPVFNLENHFALDQSTLNYETNYADNLNAMLWQGAIHGLSGSHTWLWGRSDETYPNFINTTVQYRADVMAQVGKTGLDINRLIDEITALREKKADAAILFSETARSYNRQYENSLYKSYTGALGSGVKTDLITESKIANLKNYSMLIIPEATHVPDAVVNEIYTFVQGGGKVLMLAEDCLKYNNNGEVRSDTSKLSVIKASATVITGGTRNLTGSKTATVSNTAAQVKNFCKTYGNPDVEIVDESGESVDDIEVSFAENAGKLLVNLCNYSSSNLTVRVKYKNDLLDGMTNLIDGTATDGLITLEPNIPMLLSADCDTAFAVGRPVFGKMDFGENPFSADGDGGTVTENNIKSLSDGYIFASVDIYSDGSTEDVMLILTAGNEEMIKSVSAVNHTLEAGKNTVTAVVNTNNVSDGDYLELFVWDGSGFKPVAGTYRLN